MGHRFSPRKAGPPFPRHKRPVSPVPKKAKAEARSVRQQLRRIRERPAHPPFEEGAEPLNNLVVIGGSAGGLAAAASVLHSVPLDFPAPIVVILHQHRVSAFELAPVIERMTSLPVVTVSEPVALRRGVVYIPAIGKALSFRRGDVSASVGGTSGCAYDHRPDVQVGGPGARRSRHRGRPDRIPAGRDGGAPGGARRGGLTIVQDPDGAEYPDMPRNAMSVFPVTFRLALPDIGFALDLLVRRSTRLESGIAVSLRLLKNRVALLVRLIKQCGRNDVEASTYLKEELVTLNRDFGSITRLLKTVPPEIKR